MNYHLQHIPGAHSQDLIPGKDFFCNGENSKYRCFILRQFIIEIAYSKLYWSGPLYLGIHAFALPVSSLLLWLSEHEVA